MPPSRVSYEELQQALAAARRPVVALLWADWSRPAVEILPTAAELAMEYEDSVVFWTLALGESDIKPRGFPAGARHFVLYEDPAVVLSRFGFQDAPAALLYASGGELRLALGSTDEAPLAPADLADAIEALVQ